MVAQHKLQTLKKLQELIEFPFNLNNNLKFVEGKNDFFV
jgi:hypothetical protein